MIILILNVFYNVTLYMQEKEGCERELWVL